MREPRQIKYEWDLNTKNSKRLEMDNVEGAVWGEEVGQENEAKLEFSGSGVAKPSRNKKV